jgi:hypothetical protein
MGECFLVVGYRHTDHDLSTVEAELKTADADITSKEEIAVSVLLALVRGKFGFST